MKAVPVLFTVALLAGCSNDALYTYCTERAQCGSRHYEMGDREYDIHLECIEVTAEVEPGRTTVGNFCTLPCTTREDCVSRVGLGGGHCITLEGDTRSYCYQRCDVLTCYPSSSCETLTVSGTEVQVCVPTRLPE